MADETNFAGLRRLHLGDPMDEEFLYGNPTTIDRLLRIGTTTHRHDAHAALAEPADLVPLADTDDIGGTIPAEQALYVGATFVDADGGETTLSDVTLVTTRDALVEPSTPPTLDAVAHDAGTLLANDYTYAVTVVDGTGGETPLGPGLLVTVDPGNPMSSIHLSGLADIVTEVGGTGWRLWRQVGSGRWGLVDDGVGDTLVDDGSFCVNCDVEPPSSGTTASTSVLRVTIPGPPPALATNFNVYVSLDGTFSSPCLVGTYPIADLGVEKTYTSLDLQIGAPPTVNLSLPGAAKIDPDTELVDWHWKRPVANAAALPDAAAGAEEGDVRVTLDDGLPHRYIGGAWGVWAMGGGGGSTTVPLETHVPIWQKDGVDVVWLRAHERETVETLTDEDFTGAAASLGDGYARDGSGNAIPEAGANDTNAIHYLPYVPAWANFYDGHIERTFTIESMNWTRIGVTLGHVRVGLFAWITPDGNLIIATRTVDSNLEADFTVLVTEPLPGATTIGDTYNLQLDRTGNHLNATVHSGKVVIAEADADIPVPLQADYGQFVSLEAGMADRWTDPDAWTTDLFRVFYRHLTRELYVEVLQDDNVMTSERIFDGIGDVYVNLGSQAHGVYSADWGDDPANAASYLRHSSRTVALSGRAVKSAGVAPVAGDVIATLDEEAWPVNNEILSPVATGDSDGEELGMVRITMTGDVVWVAGRSTLPATKSPYVSLDGITYPVS